MSIPTNQTIYNITRKYKMRAKRVLVGIDNCAMAWVEYGKSARDLTPAESVAARNEQARARQMPAHFEEKTDYSSGGKVLQGGLCGL